MKQNLKVFPIVVAILLSFFLPLIADAQLPNGFMDIEWGSSMEEVQAKRGKILEKQGHLTDDKITFLFETTSESFSISSIRYTFYRDKLFAVDIFYSDKFNDVPNETMVAKFKNRYGKNTNSYTYTNSKGEEEIHTIWKDKTTSLLLIKNMTTGSFSCQRISLKIYNEKDEEEKSEEALELQKKIEKLELD